MRDVDGNKIFEGDVLESIVCKVGTSNRIRLVINDIRYASQNALLVDHFRIVGNIHDNPELLKENGNDKQ